MREATDRIIDGETYSFYQMDPKTGVKILIQISKMVGPALAAGGDQILRSGSIKELLNKELENLGKEISLSKIVDALVMNLDEDNTMMIVDKLCVNIQYKGKSLSEIFEVHFQGEYLRLVKVIKTALEVQFGNFFSAIIELIGSTVQPTTPVK